MRTGSLQAIATAAVLTVLAVACASTALADADADITSKEQELENLRQRIRQHQQRAEALERDEKNQLTRLSELEKEAALIEELLARLREKEKSIAANSAEVEDRIAAAQADVDAQREQLARGLRTMYKRQRTSTLALVVAASSLGDLAARVRAYTHIARREQELIGGVLAAQRELQDQRALLLATLAEVHQTQSEAEDRKLRLAQLRDQKQLTLASVRQERERFEASLEEMERSARAMEDLLGSLERRRQQGRDTDAGGFATAKGTLPWPLHGTILKPFGRSIHPEFKTVVVNKGINIAAPMGTPIRVVAQGKVDYVNWLPGYGKCVIVNHGGGYYTLYAHASEIFPHEGDVVEAGEIIGEAGDTGSLNGSQLYFEIRQGKDPLNPGLWLSAR